MNWLGRELNAVSGLYNDTAIDHFIATKQRWSQHATEALGSPTVLETHAGYGLTTLTYALSGAKQVTAFDKSASAIEALRQNCHGLNVRGVQGNSETDLPAGSFDIVDIDASGSPQFALDAVLKRPRPLVLFVTVGDALYFRFRRQPTTPAGVKRYPRAFPAFVGECDKGMKEFGKRVVLAHIQEAWPDAVLSAYHVWPLTSNSRLVVTFPFSPQVAWDTPEQATVWAMAQAVRGQ